MKKATLIIGLALAAGFTGTAQATVDMAGSDTLELIMQDLVTGCAPGYDSDGGGLEINYIGGGSGNAAAAMERDSGERTGSGARHQLGPMSRSLRTGAECVQGTVLRTDEAISGGGVAAGWPAVRPALIIIGRDDIINLAPAALAGVTDSGSGDGTPDDWGADLRTLYFGIDDATYAPTLPVANAAVAANCASAARSSLRTTLGLYHIYRRDDASGTTQDWKLLGAVPRDQPYCNTPGVNPLTTDESQNDKSDRDPIRITCNNGEDVCSCDGTLGLVLPILVPPVSAGLSTLYPTTACGTAQNLVFTQVDHNGNAMTKNLRNGRSTDTGDRCPGGAGRLGTSGCIWWETALGDANCIQPNVDQNANLALNAALITSSGGLCPTDNSNDIRSANLTVREADGDVLNAGGSPTHNASIVDWEGRAYYRIHMTTGSTNAMGSAECQEPNATRQIGCLVERDDANGKVSLGYAGLESVDVAGEAYALTVDGVDSAKVESACIGDPCAVAGDCTCGAGMVCSAGVCAAGPYPYARKLYVNVLSYWDPTGTYRTDPPAPNAASHVQNDIYAEGDEADLLECVLAELTAGKPTLAIDDLVETTVATHGFLPRLPTDPVIEPSCPGL